MIFLAITYGGLRTGFLWIRFPRGRVSCFATIENQSTGIALRYVVLFKPSSWLDSLWGCHTMPSHSNPTRQRLPALESVAMGMLLMIRISRELGQKWDDGIHHTHFHMMGQKSLA